MLARHPEEPLPFVWRCHLCGSVYRLGVTRRCLEDGHTFCSLPSPPSSPISTPNTQLHTEEDLKALARAANRRKKARRHRVRGCRTEFDYASWEIYNIWRREINYLRREKEGKAEFDEDKVWGDNCYTDCDFPSQCHNARLHQLRLARQRAIEEDMEQMDAAQIWEEMRERMAREAEADEMLEASEITPIGPEEPLSTDEFVLETERRGLEDSAMMIDVNLGSLQLPAEVEQENELGIRGDENKEKELNFTKRKWKKSILKIRQLTGLMMGTEIDDLEMEPKKPNSPLQHEFLVDDLSSEDEIESLKKESSRASGIDKEDVVMLETNGEGYNFSSFIEDR